MSRGCGCCSYCGRAVGLRDRDRDRDRMRDKQHFWPLSGVTVPGTRGCESCLEEQLAGKRGGGEKHMKAHHRKKRGMKFANPGDRQEVSGA